MCAALALSLSAADDESPEDLARRAYLHSMLMRGAMRPELAFEHAAASGSRGLRSSRGGPALVDPFRNFADEAASWRPAAAAASSSPAGGSGPARKAKGGSANLSKLFAPPEELLLTGARGEFIGFEGALAEALRQRKWLLINVQQSDEFSSHQLNRDVWRDPAVHACVKAHFIFCQLNHSTADGQRYRNLYRPPSIPSIAIMDPITRGKMWDCHAEVASDVAPGKPPPSAASIAKGEIVINKQFIARLQRTLREWAARKDLQVDATPMQPVRTAAQQEEALLQAAINASLEGVQQNLSPEIDLTAASPSPASSSSSSSAAAASAASVAAASRPAAAAARPSAASAAKAVPIPPRSAAATKPAPVANKSSPIVLDDDDDDDDESEGWAQDDAADEEYVQISDSEGEIDAMHASAPQDDDATMGAARHKTHNPTVTSKRDAAAVVIDGGAAASSSENRRKRALSDPAATEEESKSQPAIKHPRLSPTKSSKAAATTVAAGLPLITAPSKAPLAPAPAVAAVSAVIVPPEPALGSSPLVCRLQVRLPAGAGRSAVQRRFLKTDAIKIVLAFAREMMPQETRNKQIMLVTAYPRRELKDEEVRPRTRRERAAALRMSSVLALTPLFVVSVCQLSIEEHGVAGASVIVEIVEP